MDVTLLLCGEIALSQCFNLPFYTKNLRMKWYHNCILVFRAHNNESYESNQIHLVNLVLDVLKPGLQRSALTGKLNWSH